MVTLLLLAAAWAAPPQVVDVTRVDHVVADDRGVSVLGSNTVFHLVLQDQGQPVDVSCRTTTPPGPTCEAALPGGRARRFRVASLVVDGADRFVQQPAVWIGETRLVGRLAPVDLGRALLQVDLAAGRGWTATALVGLSLGDGEGRPLFPPDEAFKGGATDVQADLLASWRCGALEGGAATSLLQAAPAAAVAWLTAARVPCGSALIWRVQAPLCAAWANAPEAAAWCATAGEPEGGVESGVAVGPVREPPGFLAAAPGRKVVPISEITWRSSSVISEPPGTTPGPDEVIRCRLTLDLDAEGTPTLVQVAACPAPYAAVVEEGVRGWRASPIFSDGVAVPVRTGVTIEFRAP